MKILANVLYGLKQILWFIALVTGFILLEEFFVFLLYSFAVEAHIPLTNFDVFMENVYYLIAIFSIFSGFALWHMGHNGNGKKVSIVIFINGLCALFAAYSGGLHLAIFEAIVFLTFKSVFLSFVGAVLCSILFRVMMNRLFRQLFTQAFQEKCEVSLFTENGLRTFKPLRKMIYFFHYHFQNPEKNWIAKSNWQDIRAELTSDCSGESPYVKEPEDIVDDSFSVKVSFKFIPRTFVFFERIWKVNGAQEAMLFNQENEK